MNFRICIKRLRARIFRRNLRKSSIQVGLTPQRKFRHRVSSINAILASFRGKDRKGSKATVPIMLCRRVKILLLGNSSGLSRRAQASSTHRVLRTSFEYPNFGRPINGANVMFRHVSKEVHSTRHDLQCRTHFRDVFSEEGCVPHLIRSTRSANGIRALNVLRLMRRPTRVYQGKVRTRYV